MYVCVCVLGAGCSGRKRKKGEREASVMPPSSKAVIWSNGACVCVRDTRRERECPVAVFEQSSLPLVCLEKPLCCPSLSLSLFSISLSCFFCRDAAGEHVSSVLKTSSKGNIKQAAEEVTRFAWTKKIIHKVEHKINGCPSLPAPLFLYNSGTSLAFYQRQQKIKTDNVLTVRILKLEHQSEKKN